MQCGVVVRGYSCDVAVLEEVDESYFVWTIGCAAIDTSLPSADM